MSTQANAEVDTTLMSSVYRKERENEKLIALYGKDGSKENPTGGHYLLMQNNKPTQTDFTKVNLYNSGKDWYGDNEYTGLATLDNPGEERDKDGKLLFELTELDKEGKGKTEKNKLYIFIKYLKMYFIDN